MEFFQNTSHVWLITGALLIILEFALMPGVGFLFAGLGAITVGALLQAGLVNEQIWEWVIFLGATLIWALVLWKPLTKFKSSHHTKPFSDMIGKKAILYDMLEPGKTGRARWSGTIMNARLEAGIKDTFSEGREVTITHVEGNTLIVK